FHAKHLSRRYALLESTSTDSGISSTPHVTQNISDYFFASFVVLSVLALLLVHSVRRNNQRKDAKDRKARKGDSQQLRPYKSAASTAQNQQMRNFGIYQR